MCRLKFQMAAPFLVLSLILSGCATTDNELATGGPSMNERDGASATDGSGIATRGARGAQPFQGTELQDPASPLAKRVVYFDFDSNVVKAEYMPILKAHGEYLATHPENQVAIEGHTDERGSREYNLALGERRAKAVQRILELNGAAKEQISTVSYGEEKPLDPGHTEAALTKNRRALIVYRQ
ncbi:MAG: peptidoglycan-associated lipoprotein Pal [Nitrococcus mobilis]|nr:peptidoglycan-associated lipoprotein Pal [Nitrococcus mobilis]